MSDPCQQSIDSATELSECSGGGSCAVPNSFLSSSDCVVCCSDPAISTQFTINSVGSCTTIKGKELDIKGVPQCREGQEKRLFDFF